MLLLVLALWRNHQLRAHKFWGHDLGSTDAALRERIGGGFGHAEIDQLHLGVLRQRRAADEDVLRLEIAVDDLPVVDELQALGGLLQDAADNVLFEVVAPILDVAGQLASLHQLHDDHDVLRLGGAWPESVVAPDALTHVGVALNLEKHVSLLADLFDLLCRRRVHQQAPNRDRLDGVLRVRILLPVAEVHRALTTDAQDLVRLNFKGVVRGAEDLKLLDGAEGPSGNARSTLRT
mmetsp:Transcript_4691/g.11798  ORF Transcript_4691/g.11798 Transcript_4691/m.11798 type:complete len:235 (-) Transcript_4691:237-941(-)